MQSDFWHRRWQKNEIGFHRSDFNPRLQQWWPAMQIAPGGAVFVPLCGKSLDMVWLRQQGHPVVGIELSELALKDFGETHQLPLQWHSAPPFEVAIAEGYCLYQGDFFQLESGHLRDVAAVYDRAALIALPPEMRADYVAHMRRIVPVGCPLLLITMAYPQEEMPGPPFSVGDEEVRQLFAGGAVELLAEYAALPEFPGFAERGISALTERVYRIHLQV